MILRADSYNGRATRKLRLAGVGRRFDSVFAHFLKPTNYCHKYCYKIMTKNGVFIDDNSMDLGN